MQILTWVVDNVMRPSEIGPGRNLRHTRGTCLMSAVELSQIRKRFGDVNAVVDVSLGAERGEVVTLVGPNGAGKTTTIEITEGLTRPDGGVVRVLGEDPRTAGPRLMD